MKRIKYVAAQIAHLLTSDGDETPATSTNDGTAADALVNVDMCDNDWVYAVSITVLTDTSR